MTDPELDQQAAHPVDCSAGGTAEQPAARADAAGRADAVALGLDAASVLIFVLLGRGSHREGSVLTGTLATAWPFLAGAGLGWAAVLLLRRGGGRPWPGRSLAAGGTVLAGTVIGGMALRRVAGGGTPLSFVIVATSFLALFLLGWRAAVQWRRR